MESRSETERSSTLSGINFLGSGNKNESGNSFQGGLINLKAMVPQQIGLLA
jgi:hypothetical protein